MTTYSAIVFEVRREATPPVYELIRRRFGRWARITYGDGWIVCNSQNRGFTVRDIRSAIEEVQESCPGVVHDLLGRSAGPKETIGKISEPRSSADWCRRAGLVRQLYPFLNEDAVAVLAAYEPEPVRIGVIRENLGRNYRKFRRDELQGIIRRLDRIGLVYRTGAGSGMKHGTNLEEKIRSSSQD